MEWHKVDEKCGPGQRNFKIKVLLRTHEKNILKKVYSFKKIF